MKLHLHQSGDQQKKIDALQAENATLKSLQGLDLFEENQALKKQVDSLTKAAGSTFALRFEELETSHRDQIAELKAKHTSAMKNLRATQNGKHNALKAEKTNEIKALEISHKAELEQINADLEAERSAKQKLQEQVNELATGTGTERAERLKAQQERDRLQEVLSSLHGLTASALKSKAAE